MRVFGIDCGTEYTGWGVVQSVETVHARHLVPIAAGAIKLNKKQSTPQRLQQVYAELIVRCWKPMRRMPSPLKTSSSPPMQRAR